MTNNFIFFPNVKHCSLVELHNGVLFNKVILNLVVFCDVLIIYRKRLKNIAKKEANTKWDERHWSEKSVDEMRERDWRIFKEDYNIACKGGNIPMPLRNWKEMKELGVAKEIIDVIEKAGYKVSKNLMQL